MSAKFNFRIFIRSYWFMFPIGQGGGDCLPRALAGGCQQDRTEGVKCER